jgi:hypothetical protein
LRRAAVDPNDEGSFGGRDHAGGRHQQRRLCPFHRPRHFGVHPWCETQVGIPDIELHWHRSRLRIEIMRRETDDAVKRLAWERWHAERDARTVDDCADQRFGNGDDEPETRDLVKAKQRRGTSA